MQISEVHFAGEAPRMARRLLPGSYARTAVNCELRSGELRSIFANRPISAIAPGTQDIYPFFGRFVAFDSDVDVAEQPGQNAIPRLFVTGGDGGPRQTDQDSEGQSFTRMGVPKPLVLPTQGSVVGSPVNDDIVFDTFYTFTLVNKYGEEGDRSDPTEAVQVADGIVVSFLNLQNLTDGLPDHAIEFIRVYRITRLGANRLVTELPIGTGSFVETIDETTHTVAPLFQSDDYFPPPVDMINLHIMANGVALGSVGREVYVSEPFIPGAMPASFTAEAEVIAISSFDNTAVILTTENPELATIYDPRNINNSPLTIREPCVSRRGVVQGEGGVLYPSPGALIYIGPSGYRIVTLETHDLQDWQDLQPSTFNAAYRDGQYIAFYGTEDNGGGWIFDFRDSGGRVRRLSQWSSAVHVLEGTDDMFMATPAGLLELYQGGTDRVEKQYRSRTYGAGMPVAMSAARLLARETRQNLDADEQIAYEAFRSAAAIESARVAALRMNLSPLFGLGGAVGQDTFAGVNFQSLGGATIVDGATFAGDALTAIPPDYDAIARSELLNIYGNGELIDSIQFLDEEPERIIYAERFREWEWESIGTLNVQQIDIASTISAMGGY